MKSQEEQKQEIEERMTANQSQVHQNNPNPIPGIVEPVKGLGKSVDEIMKERNEIEKQKNEEMNKKTQELMKKDDELRAEEQRVRAKAAQTTTKSPVTGEQVPIGHVIPGHTGGLNPTIDKIREEQEQTRRTEDEKRVKLAHQPSNPMSSQPQPSVIVGKGAFEQKTIQNVRAHNWQTEDGLPPRFEAGNLEPINAKKVPTNTTPNPR